MALSVKRLMLLGLLMICNVAAVYAHDETKGENTDQVAVAIFPGQFPLQYHLTPEGEPYGYAIEVLDEVARKAGVTIHYHPVENWQTAWQALVSGEADIIPGLGITTEREKEVLFTLPFESMTLALYVREGNSAITGLNDLQGKRVSAIINLAANNLVANLELITFPDEAQTLQALIQGETDAIIMPVAVAEYLTDSSGLTGQIVQAGPPLKEIQRSIAVSKRNPELFKRINSVMTDYLLSEEFKDTQESWRREPQPKFSIDQLIYLNTGLFALLVVMVLGIGLYNAKRSGIGSAYESRFTLRLVSLAAVLFIAIVATSVTSLWFLYDTALEGQKSRLVNIAQSRARMIESVARFDLSNQEKLGLSAKQVYEGTISQVRESHDHLKGFGQTGEIAFAKRSGDEIAFILRQRHSVTVKPSNVPWMSPQAEPMRRALSGRAGTLIGPDYRGITVLAAHEPVKVLNAGIVAKIDLDEIKSPYVRSGLIALAITLAILICGILLFLVLTAPLLRTLTHAYVRLRAIVDFSPGIIIISDDNGKRIISSPQLDDLEGQIPAEGESSVTHRDGTQRTYLTSVFPLTSQFKTFGSCQISTDITDRVAAETEAKQLAKAFHCTSEGMFITDLDSNILMVNRAFEEITGYTSNEAIGQKPSMLRSGRHDGKFFKDMWNSIKFSGEWRGEIWNRRKDGESYPQWLNVSTVYDDNQVPSHYVAVFSDITAQKESQEQLHHLAYHDPLTRLPNRLLFRDRLEHVLSIAHRERRTIAVFAIDLDRFKVINDSLGHQAGDNVLVDVASRLQTLVRDSDTLARMGGDEFSVIAEGFDDIEGVATLAGRIVKGMARSVELPDQKVMSSVSIGIAVYPNDGRTYEDLLKHADAALYKAKEKGRNNYQFYTAELGRTADDKLALENEILRGLEHNEFLVHYQPQFDVKTGDPVSAEALVRWQHPKYGLLSPARFIPLAEETGLIVPLGEWVLKEVCKQTKIWLNKGYDIKRVAVNLSGIQMERAGLFDSVKNILEEAQLPPDRLELEVTEGFIMREVKQSVHLLESFSSLGITIAIDDFGTGYSSLSYLKRLPVSTLKIDRSFIQDLPDDDDSAISRAVIALGHSLGMQVVAEGVENMVQWKFLSGEECDMVQGFLQGKPTSPDEFEALYLQGTQLAEKIAKRF